MAQQSGADHTESMNAYACRKVEELAGLDLSGYILKKDSPSCGMERVRVYDENDVPAKTGRGLLAAVLLGQMPHLPVAWGHAWTRLPASPTSTCYRSMTAP